MPKWLVITLVVVAVLLAISAWVYSRPNNAGNSSKLERTFTSEEQQLLDTREVTTAELAAATCADGAECWLAVNGIVYDMSGFPSWMPGPHHGIAPGTDATAQFVDSGHGLAYLEKMPVVGSLAG